VAHDFARWAFAAKYTATNPHHRHSPNCRVAICVLAITAASVRKAAARLTNTVLKSEITSNS